MKKQASQPSAFHLNTKASSKLAEQEGKRPDLGFGTQINNHNTRLINKDGSFNVRRINGSFAARLNLYHRLIVMSWPKFFGCVLGAFLVANCLFASLYYSVGFDSLTGVQAHTSIEWFWEAFFFSAQTLTTVGYGRISPVGPAGSTVAAIESLIGLLTFAVATGLLYGRFSRPTPRIRFSTNAIFAPYLDINSWMFRIINERSNQLVDVEIEVTMSRFEKGTDGRSARRYYSLALERRKITFFSTNWTLVHPITAESPLYQCTPDSLNESEAEFLIILRALDDTLSQLVHLRYSYRYDEVLWGRKFKPMITQLDHDNIILDLQALDDMDEVPLNE